MSDDTATQDSPAATEGAEAAATPAKAKRPPPEVTKVTMNDGREVSFVGKAKLLKEVLVDKEAGTVSVRFDFRNGETRQVNVPESIVLYAAGHGVSQKCGDATAGEENVDDMVVALDDVAKRLNEGEWSAPRKAGDGFAGAGVVIRAVMEATGKDMAFVKAFLDGKLAAAKAAGQTLTRQDLYKSFRKPGSKTGAIIERLEREKAMKDVKVDSDALLSEIGG